VLLKGALCTGIWPRTRRRLFAGVAVALASCAGAAFAQKKVPATPPPAAHASIVQFEESKQSRIVYFEETGGMMTRAATPVVPEREEAAPKASRTAANPEERSTSTGTGTGISAKRTAQQRAAAAAAK
jgi:hypothetical protein